MDHAEARDRLTDLAVEPARLRALDRSADPGSSELLAHLATCAECRSELESWRTTIAALDTAVATAPTRGSAPARSLRQLAEADEAADTLPAGLRGRVLAAASVTATGTAAPAASAAEAPRSIRIPARREFRLRSWLAVAAALVVVLAGAAFAVDRTRQLDQARSEAATLANVTASLDSILQDPGHRLATLTNAAGTPGGVVSWSGAQNTVVVLAGMLQSPPAGQVYRCYVDQNGSRWAVGEMEFSGSLAYWAGALDSWGPALAAGGVFQVSLEPAGGGSGTTVLTGTL
jgi:hypothetical protein